MEFSIPEEIVSVRDLTARILSEQIDDAALRRFDRGEVRWHEGVWSLLAESGLLGVALPESVGGSGLGFSALCAVLEQQGRHVAALPLLASAVLGGMPLARFGSEAQRAGWLTRVVEGSAILSGPLALSPLEALPGAMPSVRADGAEFVIDGELDPVPWGLEADAVLVPARAADGSISVFLVARGSNGLSGSENRGTDHERFASLRLAGVRVSSGERIGADGAGMEILEWTALHAATALGFIQLGVIAEALRRTAQHTLERRQFGKPLAAFQAVAHRAADAFIDVEALRSTLWQAAWRLEQGLDAGEAVAVAAWWASEAGHRVGHACQHLHGGTGADLDYPIHRFYLWAQQTRLSLGGSARNLGALGARMSTRQIGIGL